MAYKREFHLLLMAADRSYRFPAKRSMLTALKDHPDEFMDLYHRMTEALKNREKREARERKRRPVKEPVFVQAGELFAPWELDASAKLSEWEV